MTKKVIGIFVSGLLFVAIGVYLATQGVIAQETALSISTGNVIIKTLNETSTLVEIGDEITPAQNNFVVLGIIAFIVGLLELASVSVMLLKRKID